MPLRTIELSGTPREMGRQYGEELRELSREMVETRLELAAHAAAGLTPSRDRQWCLDLAAEAVPALQEYSEHVAAELQGLADGTWLSLPELVIGNGWTDFKDLLDARGASHNCTAFAVGAPLTADGHTYLAQTWDMNVTAAPYIVAVRRRPAEGPRTLSLTTAGCLSLIGMNEDGIAIGNTNLAPTDARPGVFYLALIHEALRQRTLTEAVAAITEASRMSGHYYYLGDAADQFVGLETTAARHAARGMVGGRFVHTNHYLDEGLLQSGVMTPPGAHSRSRQQRCSELVAELEPRVAVTQLSQIMSDHQGENCICRHVDAGAEWATLAAAAMAPATRQMWMWAGTPCHNEVICLEP
jgi:isopenicillin-N N-acyltransferase-like protein